MAPKKKSLADELADLFNPAPTKEFDPEADVFGAGPALEDSDDELAAAQPARRRGKEGARLRGDLVIEGREYAGRRSSRAALFGEADAGQAANGEEGSSGSDVEGSDGESSGSDAEGIDGEGNDVEGSGEDSSSDEEGQPQDDAGWLDGGRSGSDDDDEAPEEEAAGSGGAGRRAARRAAAAAGEAGADGELAVGSSDDEEGRGGHAAVAAASADDEMAALEREYEQMQQDEQTAMAGLKERAARERKKALAVQAQKAVWQRGLEARILLQRALAGGNRLPQGEMQSVAAGSSADVAAAFAGLAADASALLQDLLQLLGALAGQNPAVAEAAAAAGSGGQAAAAAEGSGGGHKRARDEANGGQGQPQDAARASTAGREQGPGADVLWEQLEAAHGAFAPFRDASIDRWHRKTTLTAGGATLRGGQLKALNQSVSTQVAQLMQDPGRVLERTRLPRSTQQQHASRVLCPDPEAAPASKRGRWSDDKEPAANGVDAKLEDERDPETYDDSEFYQTLLREFLEGSADAGGANWHTGPKHRKAVDRRASKGRKLRYHVHPKLVNFMTPVELEAPQFAAQLFSNLFGGTASRGTRK